MNKQQLKTSFYTQVKGLALLTTVLFSMLSSVKAQTINNANITGAAEYACPACTTLTSLEALNADMMHLKPTYTSDELVYGYVFSGGVGAKATGTVTDQTFIHIKNNQSASSIYEELPMRETEFGLENVKVPGTIVPHDPDMAMGSYHDPINGSPQSFAAVVYEVDGEIYLEVWGFDLLSNGNHHSVLPVTAVNCIPAPSWGNPCILTGGQYQLSNANGNAIRPHIDLIVDKDNPTDPVEVSTKYVVSWEENGVVMNAEGDLFNAPMAPIVIADGHSPDIAGVSNYEYARSTPDYDDDMVYTTYIDDNTGDLMLAERKYGDPTVLNYHVLEYATDYTTHYPRIAGARYYDYSLANNVEPTCVVTATVDDGVLGAYEVKSYTLYDPTNITPGIYDVNVSDYNANGRFTSTPLGNCIMPIVTGTGVYTRDKYTSNASGGFAPNPDFSIIFYSDYTWDGSAYDPYGNGDLYNSNIDMSTYDPVNQDYNEVNEIDYYSSWSLAGNMPLFDAASSCNSNYDIFAAFYDGEAIYYKITGGNTYSFKPTNINSIANAEVAVYPNPVTTAVTIGEGDGSDYTVTDITGKVMASGVIKGNKYTISTDSYAAGTYILQLVKDGVPSTVKFVKQ